MTFKPVAFTLVLLIGLAGSAVFAKPKRGAGNSQKGQTPPANPENGQDAAPPPPPPVDNPSPTTKPSDELGQASAALDAASKKAMTTFESSPEWTADAAAVTLARSEYDTARAAAVTAMKSKPEYQAAVENSAKAQKTVDDLRNGGGTPDDLMTAANNAMKARAVVSQMELKGSSGDSAAAKAKLSSAVAAMSELRKQEHAAVQADPDWQAAKKAYDDAKSKPK